MKKSKFKLKKKGLKQKKKIESDDPLKEFADIPLVTTYCRTARMHSIEGFRDFNDTLHLLSCKECQEFYARLKGVIFEGINLWASFRVVQGVDLWKSGI